MNKKPNPYLIKEFSSTGQEFYMYTYGDFLTQAKKYLKAKIKQETIKKVKNREKLRDLTEELEISDEIGSSKEGNEIALLINLLSKEPELFRKIIKPGYTLTPTDSVALLKLMLKYPNSFKKIMDNSGNNLTENEKLILSSLSKQPELFNILTEELDLNHNNHPDKNSKPVKKEKNQENKKSGTKSKKSNKKKKKRT